MATFVFDLDGTIVDSAHAILGSIRFTLESVGAPAPDEASLRRVIGPPLRVAFASLLGDRGDVDHCIRIYREHYARDGLAASDPYAGVGAQLARLKGEGHALFICTSKLETFAQTIIDRIGFAPMFDGVYGEAPGASDHKAELLARLVREHAIDPSRAVMIGDRREDIVAGQRSGLATLGVLWGYGDLEELTAAGAGAICGQVDDLSPILLGGDLLGAWLADNGFG